MLVIIVVSVVSECFGFYVVVISGVLVFSWVCMLLLLSIFWMVVVSVLILFVGMSIFLLDLSILWML